MVRTQALFTIFLRHMSQFAPPPSYMDPWNPGAPIGPHVAYSAPPIQPNPGNSRIDLLQQNSQFIWWPQAERAWAASLIVLMHASTYNSWRRTQIASHFAALPVQILDE